MLKNYTINWFGRFNFPRFVPYDEISKFRDDDSLGNGAFSTVYPLRDTDLEMKIQSGGVTFSEIPRNYAI